MLLLGHDVRLHVGFKRIQRKDRAPANGQHLAIKEDADLKVGEKGPQER